MLIHTYNAYMKQCTGIVPVYLTTFKEHLSLFLASRVGFSWRCHLHEIVTCPCIHQQPGDHI